jgi:hypothetical protein
VNQIAGKGHDQLRWQWNARRLYAHQDDDAAIPGKADQGLDEYENGGKYFFSHEK